MVQTIFIRYGSMKNHMISSYFNNSAQCEEFIQVSTPQCTEGGGQSTKQQIEIFCLKLFNSCNVKFVCLLNSPQRNYKILPLLKTFAIFCQFLTIKFLEKYAYKQFSHYVYQAMQNTPERCMAWLTLNYEIILDLLIALRFHVNS